MEKILDFIAYANAYVTGWIVVDIIANILLKTGNKFSKLRFFGGRFLSRRKAILVAFGQLAVAIAASLYVVDWIFVWMKQSQSYLIPITLAVMAITYFYVLELLPYKITIKRALPSLGLFVVAYIIYDRISKDPQFAQQLSSFLQKFQTP